MSPHAIPMDTGDAGAGKGDGAAGGAAATVLAALASAADAGHHVPTARTGSATAARALAQWLTVPMASNAIWQALEALEAMGAIRRSTYTSSCRHVRACFVLADAGTAADAADAGTAGTAGTAADAADAGTAADATNPAHAADAIAAADADDITALAALEAFAIAHGIDWHAARSLMIPGDAEFACRQLAADTGDGAEVRCVALWLRLLAARA